MRAQLQFEVPPPPTLPDFITQHIDPFSGDDDTADIDASTGAILSNLPPLNIPQPPMPRQEPQGGAVEPPASRNAPCPCGSGKKYKHCHGQLG
jgi:preprotein translocase subunit SecA